MLVSLMMKLVGIMSLVLTSLTLMRGMATMTLTLRRGMATVTTRIAKASSMKVKAEMKMVL